MPPLRGSVQPSLYFLLPRRELLLKVLQPPFREKSVEKVRINVRRRLEIRAR
jgi:hypothetical protein